MGKQRISARPASSVVMDYFHENEAATRERKDAQFRAPGGDSKELTYGKGMRPRVGCLAIAEWPTASDPAAVIDRVAHGVFQNSSGVLQYAPT